jgi:arylformamidase
MTAYVFRDYDEAELARQVSARDTVEDFTLFTRAYAEHSARMRATLACHLDLAYGPSEAERLDIFPARAGSGPRPVFVFVHGGYWRMLDARDSSFMAETFTAAGAVVVAVNYALAPGARLGEIVRQCRAALAWVYRNIAAYGGDPARIHVSGSSAGGHLVGALLMPGWHADFGVPETIVHSASPLSGLFDLAPIRLSPVNGWLDLAPADVETMSPIRHLPAAPPPMVVAYAPSETGEFKRQSEIYAAAIAARGGEVEVIVEPGTNHFDLPMIFMDRTRALTQAVFTRMGLAG